MNNRKIGVIISLLSAFFIFPGTAAAKYSGGLGTADKPYRIATVANLLTLAANTDDYDKNFILTADINLAPNLPGRRLFTTAVIAPDTDNSNDTFDGIVFMGFFDGAGHKIINLTIDTNGAGNDYLGLFGNLVGGNIINLTLENVKITSGNDSLVIGGLVGENDGGINNCYSTVTIVSGEGTFDVGGLVGYNGLGDVSNCYSAGTVTDGNSSYGLGGLVGSDDGTINKCYSTVIVTSGDGSQYLGGLVGENGFGTITNCYSTGAVTGTDYLGGLLGENAFGDINNCYSTGVVTGGAGSTNLGGLMGDIGFGAMSGCYFLETSGPDNGFGDPLTDEEMKQQVSFAGWDFIGETVNGDEDIWWINEGISYPTLVRPLEIAKCTVTASSRENSDRISISGQMGATANDFNEADAVIVTVDANDIVNPFDQNFPIDANTFKKGKYNYLKTVDDVRKSFTYDLKTHKFAFSASNVDLSGLDCPVTVAIEIGNFYQTAEIDETIVNGPKVPIPIKLMMGVKDVLRVDKCQVKHGKNPNTDQLSVKGAFAVEDPNVNMADRISEDLVVTLGAQQFTIPANKLKAGKGTFSCSKANVTEVGGGIATATFNFNTCSFILTIKNTANITATGTVDFGVAFADFNEVEQVTLP